MFFFSSPYKNQHLIKCGCPTSLPQNPDQDGKTEIELRLAIRFDAAEECTVGKGRALVRSNSSAPFLAKFDGYDQDVISCSIFFYFDRFVKSEYLECIRLK